MGVDLKHDKADARLYESLFPLLFYGIPGRVPCEKHHHLQFTVSSPSPKFLAPLQHKHKLTPVSPSLLCLPHHSVDQHRQLSLDGGFLSVSTTAPFPLLHYIAVAAAPQSQ